MSHALTIQSRDSTYDSSICTYPVALGNKSKDSMITESAYIDDISNREDPTMIFKACLKQHKSFVHAVLHLQFISIDQIENVLALILRWWQ